MKDLISRKELAFLYIPAIGVSAIVKWAMIHYGLPYSTHVDEMTILTDPFKIALMYLDGDFSVSTNLYNWICLGWYGLVYCVGWLLGNWSGVAEFKIFMISGSGDFLLVGRLLSALLSLSGTLVMVKLISSLKTDLWMKIVFVGLIVLNPFELNATNWVKFDALSYGVYALMVYAGYVYFVQQRLDFRSKLYVLLFIGLSARIELIAFLLGFLVYDLFFFFPFNANRFPIKAFVWGALVYCVITLIPLSFLFQLVFPPTSNLAVSPSFYEAIVSKIPPFGEMLRITGESWFYLKCLTALLGPVILLEILVNLKTKEVRFLYFPLAITFFVLMIFPIKNVHYLLGVSLLILTVYFIGNTQRESKSWKRFSLFITLLWMGTYSLQLSWLISLKGDVRLDAREYLLQHSQSGEMMYVDGIFSAIDETAERLTLKSVASKSIGSTGLSNEYRAQHSDRTDARVIIPVSSWDPFKGTVYENVFNNFYDSARLKSDRPEYYVYVAPSWWQLDVSLNPLFDRYRDYYKFLDRHYKVEKVFSYNISDPRLRFANAYYFRPVIVMRKEGNW